MDIQAVGGFFSLPFKQVYDYLKGMQETREVEKQLRNVLQSLSQYITSAAATEQSGKIILNIFDELPVPPSRQSATELVRAWVDVTKDVADVLASIHMFGRECHDLISGDFEGFMAKVKLRKPIVHDFLTFFGNNYNPKTDSLDLAKLPMLVRIYHNQIRWKESKEASKSVAEGRKSVTKVLEKAQTLVNRRGLPVITDRKLIRDSLQVLRRLVKELKSFHTTGSVGRELAENAPSWFADFMEMSEEVQRAYPKLSKHLVQRYQRYGPARRV